MRQGSKARRLKFTPDLRCLAVADSCRGNQRYEVSEDQRLGQAKAHGAIRSVLVFLLSLRLIDSLYTERNLNEQDA